ASSVCPRPHGRAKPDLGWARVWRQCGVTGRRGCVHRHPLEKQRRGEPEGRRPRPFPLSHGTSFLPDSPVPPAQEGLVTSPLFSCGAGFLWWPWLHTLASDLAGCCGTGCLTSDPNSLASQDGRWGQLAREASDYLRGPQGSLCSWVTPTAPAPSAEVGAAAGLACGSERECGEDLETCISSPRGCHSGPSPGTHIQSGTRGAFGCEHLIFLVKYK
ncbi:hypothetical protein H1C71_015108, partial [Ictidomys tridecemlineatus]